MTPEQLTEQAFALLAEDGADWERYKTRLAGLTAAIAAYGASLQAAQRERDAQWLEGRAERMDRGEPGSPARWMARIFRDEAQALRAQS